MTSPDLETLLAAAVRAPSSHNTQPWRFRPTPAGVDLLADRTRALPVNDPHDRELAISCGCALLNLRVQAAALGLSARVALVPDPDDADLLASVALEPATFPEDDAVLAPAIPRRRTHRAAFDGPDVPTDAAGELERAVRAEGAHLTTIDDAGTRRAVAALVAEGDTALWDDVRWRRELAAWMHPSRTNDGLPVPALALRVAQRVVGAFDLGAGVGARDRALTDGAPLLALLSTDGDGPADWLRAGQALERALLVGVGLGLQASFLNPPVQVPALCPRLRAVARAPGHPQLLLRFGRTAAAPPPTARRPVHEVLLPVEAR